MSTPTLSGGEEAEIKAALDKLSADDRKLADAQKSCPMSDEPLGSMGIPIKLTLSGEPVFVCCRSCVKRAEADPTGTLKKVAALKAKPAAK
ncbi:hypothetical protein [Fimbriiglobus ruber]|uniref:Putative Co/Zn/Cd efflux system membrane fusion protein n=1 Tax=Fimbriiglobus ruber TaxID=1908690 RepID=A0A225DYH8_9BACT|nr:hypothetical protein [Fimbriiglobus ruber]OWK46382.1 putative Co/Zn/Cd efflux system membrane fusion protein [Fimbriiglobus ruber]